MRTIPWLMVVVTLASAAAGSAGPAHAAPDPGWQGGGISVIAGSTRSSPAGQTIAADGSTYVLMNYTGDAPYGDRIVRLEPDGDVDLSFGTGGVARPQTDSGMTFLSQSSDGIAVDPVSGRIFAASAAGGWGVAALMPNGQPDTSWGAQGWTKVLAGPGGTWTYSPGASPQLAIDPLGRILLAGYVGHLGGGPIYVTVARLTTTGELDSTFGQGGLVTVPFADQPTNTMGAVSSLELDGKGRVLVGGWTPAALAFASRLDANGHLDQSFGTNGSVVMSGVASCVNDLAADPAGGVLLLCQYPEFGLYVPVVRRLTETGAVDRQFGTGGIAAVPRRVSPTAVGRSIAVVDGLIVIGGWSSDEPPYSNPSPVHRAALWRFTMEGDLDLGEGTGGVELINGGTGAEATDLELAPGGVLSTLLMLPDGYTGPGVGVQRSITTGGVAVPSAVPLSSPQRVLDTRIGLGAPRGQITQGGVIQLQIVGVAGVPSNARAVAMNLTVTDPSFAGFATVYSCGATRPEASNLNWAAGQTVPNLVIARPDATGKVCIFSSSPADLVADISAFFPVDTDLRPLETPVRRIDSRSTVFHDQGKIGGTRVATMSVIPIPGQTVLSNEVVVNVTVTEPEAAGYLTVYPCDQPRPVASNLNFVAGQTVANLAVVRASSMSGACFFSNVPTHLVVDVQALVELGSGHRPIAPQRLLDTRSSLGAAAGPTTTSPVELQVTGRAGIPESARSVTLNVTVTESASAGFVAVYPCGGAIPSTSNVNFQAGETRSNAVIVGIGTSGRVCLYSNVPAQLVADVSEWFTARG